MQTAVSTIGGRVSRSARDIVPMSLRDVSRHVTYNRNVYAHGNRMEVKRLLPGKTEPNPDVRQGSLCVNERTMKPCIVDDDDVQNPIRLVKVYGTEMSVESAFAEDLMIVDHELFELAIAAISSAGNSCHA